MSFHSLQLATSAGHTITVKTFQPEQPKAVVIVAGAVGVPQYHYEKFARWLSQLGYAAITFDYDGIGESVDGHVKNSRSDMMSWGRNDASAVLDHAAGQYPNLKINWVGHSVGGQLLGFLGNAHLIDKVVTVASGSGYWWHNSAPTKRIVWLLWFLIVPVVVPLAGYFPGRTLNMVGDLPKPMMQQWRRWCLNHRYALGVEGDAVVEEFEQRTFPMTGIWFSDDEMMSAKSIESLHGFYPNAPKQMICVKPEDAGHKRIGHLGWFKDRYQSGIWEQFILPELVSN